MPRGPHLPTIRQLGHCGPSSYGLLWSCMCQVAKYFERDGRERKSQGGRGESESREEASEVSKGQTPWNFVGHIKNFGFYLQTTESHWKFKERNNTITYAFWKAHSSQSLEVCMWWGMCVCILDSLYEKRIYRAAVGPAESLPSGERARGQPRWWGSEAEAEEKSLHWPYFTGFIWGVGSELGGKTNPVRWGDVWVGFKIERRVPESESQRI